MSVDSRIEVILMDLMVSINELSWPDASISSRE